MLVTRGLGLGGRGPVVTLGLGIRVIDLTDLPLVHDGTTYRQTESVFAKHPVDGWVPPKEVWRRTAAGWRRVI